MTYYFTILVLIIGVIIYNLILIVPMREVTVIERLGKFRDVLKPGLHFLIPFFDRVAYRHDTREQVLDIPSQSCISKDNTQIEVDGLVYLKVMDAKKCSYGIGNYRMASVNLAQTTMRAEVGKLTLSQLFSEREKLNEVIVSEIDKASDPWGIKVLRYEIKNIKPSPGVIHTLEKQMEAERSKRAEITLAKAEKDSVTNISEGLRQEAINYSEGEKIKRINEAKGKAQQIKSIAEATAQGIKLVAEAVNSNNGKTAVKVQLMEQYIQELGSVLKTSKVSILPKEMANIKGFFEGVENVTQSVRNKQ